MSTVLGRPVKGEVYHYGSKPVEQWPDEKFLKYLDAVLDCEGVEAVRWEQYIPSFNDGDPCVFTLHDPLVRLVDAAVDEDDEYEDGFIDTFSMYDYAEPYSHPGTKIIRPGFAQIYPALLELQNAFPHFEDFIHASFGDNATVTATKADGFEIDYYEGGY